MYARQTFWIVTIAALAFASGCKKDDAVSSPPKADITVSATPDFTMSAQEYSKAFMVGDQEATKAKYAGKTIQLTGVVRDFSSMSRGTYFDIKGEGFATLHFYPEDMKAWKNVAGGNTVTARGLYMSDGGFGMNHCILVSATGAPVPAMTSKALAEKFYADSYQFNQQYQQTEANVVVNHCMRIDGKVVAKQEGKWDARQLVLEGTDDKHLVPVSMPISVNPNAPDPRGEVQIGQHVTVYGAWAFPDGKDPKDGMLHDAVIIPD